MYIEFGFFYDKNMISQEQIKEILNYNEKNGIFTWNNRPLSHFKTTRDCIAWNSLYSLKVAGTK
jgi:hypothetical protein